MKKTKKAKSPAKPRKRRSKREAGSFQPRSIPGALVLSATLLALLVAFHVARERLSPPTRQPRAAVSDVGLGR